MGSYAGVYGLGVMGQSLALNIANHGYSVSVYNRHADVTREFMVRRVEGQDKSVVGFDNLKNFVESLDRPRKVILMVKAGEVVDMVSEEIMPYLQPGDILVDAGNSYYKDTERRIEALLREGNLLLRNRRVWWRKGCSSWA